MIILYCFANYWWFLSNKFIGFIVLALVKLNTQLIIWQDILITLNSLSNALFVTILLIIESLFF